MCILETVKAQKVIITGEGQEEAVEIPNDGTVVANNLSWPPTSVTLVDSEPSPHKGTICVFLK
jgi:hypothetical protein